MIRLISFLLICIALQFYGQVESKTVPKKVEKMAIFTKVDYEVNKDLMEMEVVLKNDTGAMPTVDLDANLYIDIPSNVYGTNTISKRGAESEYHALLKTGRVNLCEYFKNPDREPFLKMLLSSLNQYGRMLFECPVQKGKYYLKDFRLDSSVVPPFAPAGDYRVDFAVTKKDGDSFTPIFRMIWYAQIVDV